MAYERSCPVVIGSRRCGRVRSSRKQLTDHMLICHLAEPVSLRHETYRILPVNGRTRSRWVRLHDHLGLRVGQWPPGLYPKRGNEKTSAVHGGKNGCYREGKTTDGDSTQTMKPLHLEESHDASVASSSDNGNQSVDGLDWQELAADMSSLFELAETAIDAFDVNDGSPTQQRPATPEDSEGRCSVQCRNTPPASPDEEANAGTYDQWLPPPTTSPRVVQLRQELAVLIEQARPPPGMNLLETFALVDGQITALQTIISSLQSIPTGPCRSCPLARGPCRLCLIEVFQPVLDGSRTPAFPPSKDTDSCRMLDPHEAVITTVQDALDRAPESGCITCVLPAQLCRHCWLTQLSNELLPLMVHRQ